MFETFVYKWRLPVHVLLSVKENVKRFPQRRSLSLEKARTEDVFPFAGIIRTVFQGLTVLISDENAFGQTFFSIFSFHILYFYYHFWLSYWFLLFWFLKMQPTCAIAIKCNGSMPHMNPVELGRASTSNDISPPKLAVPKTLCVLYVTVWIWVNLAVVKLVTKHFAPKVVITKALCVLYVTMQTVLGYNGILW